MTIHKLTAGDGYTYLTRQVAGGDVNREPGQDAAGYYAANGNPPGSWVGRGAPLLGLAGQQVTEEQMRALFGHGQHPNSEAMIQARLAASARSGMSAAELAKSRREAIRAATLGRPFPSYEPLEKFDVRVRRRLAIITQETGRAPTEAEVKKVHREEARRQRAAVAGFDAVFAPVKSAVLLWALDERPWVRDAVRQAHEDAKNAALELLEEHAAFTRTGTGGIAQIRTRGLIAAAFDHYDSRDGDPNLHTHVAISSKVQGTDGQWRALDARVLYRITVAASECYNTAFETGLTARLGVTFVPRPDTRGDREPVREISHVSFGMIKHFSSRRASIETRYAQLMRAYRREHGHDPSRSACHQLARQANLDTRAAKKPARSLTDMRAAWRASLTEAFGRGAVRQLMAAVPAAASPRTDTARPDRLTIAQIAERAVASVASQRSTWTVWNLRAEAERITRAERSLGSLTEHRETIAAVIAEAVSPRLSIRVEAPSLLDEPAALRRGDGEPVFTEHAADRYTSQAVLDAEQRLLSAARTPVSCGLPGPAVAAAVDGYEGHTGCSLDPGQRQLVTAFASCSTLLSAGLGPAGSGKTTAMRALAFVLHQGGQRLIPLATSAAAADVLGRELGVHAENLHKFLYEHTRGRHAAWLRAGARLPATARPYVLHRGDVVLVDEAGMAGTFALDQLVQIAAHHGAVVRVLGDDRQLSAVESGGALRLIAHDVGAAELTTLYRFSDPAEAAATLKLRTGDASGLDYYLGRGRVRSGSREGMTEAAYAGWRADMLVGKTTLMTAASGSDVAALSAQARAERVDADQVETGGVPLRDGTLAGRGDWIVTRENNRRFAVHGGRDWVKNGDAWRVIKRDRDGSLRAEHLTHRGRVTLPADYVAAHVQLLYATTAHRAEGSTVDTAHALITPEMSRESFYVTASRARLRTILYTVTHDLLPLDEDSRLDAARTDPRSYAAREVLENVLAREGAELSATESIRVAQDQAGSLATLVPRYSHAAQILADARYRQTAMDVLGADTGQLLASEPAWSAVVHALQDAEATGWRPQQLLAEVADLRELATARSIAEVIAWRIEAYTADRPAPLRLDQPTKADALRYASLLRALPSFGTAALDPAVAVQPPSPWPPRAGPKLNSAQRATETVAATEVATHVLGVKLAHRARAEPAWPALVAALRRAQRHGHDPAVLLDQLARSRELRTARSLSEVLAWRIGEYLATGHGTAASSAKTGAQQVNPQTWARLAWTIKAAENSGYNAAEAVEAASHEPDPASALLALTRTIAVHRQAPSLPPWISEPAASPAEHPVTDSQLAGYLNTVADEIRKRVHALIADVTHTRAAWVNALGATPGDHARHQEWLRHLGAVAAYRDQYQITSDDPHQVLGPYAEPGHAGHSAYWHAAESVLTARTIAGLEHTNVTSNQASAQLAADLYLSLPPAERTAISAAMAERLGVLWFGTRTETDDHAATQQIYATQLAAVLTERGHLTQPNAVQASLSGAAVPVVTLGEWPVETDFARRRAGRAARNDARHDNLRQSRNGEEAPRPLYSVPSRRRTVRPAEQVNDAPLPPHLQPGPPNQRRGPAPTR